MNNKIFNSEKSLLIKVYKMNKKIFEPETNKKYLLDAIEKRKTGTLDKKTKSFRHGT